MPIKLNGVTIIDEQDLADKNLSNLTDAGNIVAAKASMPSNTSETVTLGASGTSHTAPSDGWFVFLGQSSASGQYGDIFNETTGVRWQGVAVDSGQYAIVSCPVKKGDSVKVNYNTAGSSQTLKFIYAVGSISEA